MCWRQGVEVQLPVQLGRGQEQVGEIERGEEEGEVGAELRLGRQRARVREEVGRERGQGAGRQEHGAVRGGQQFGFQPADGARFEVLVRAVFERVVDEREPHAVHGVCVQDRRRQHVRVVAEARRRALGGQDGEVLQHRREHIAVLGGLEVGVLAQGDESKKQHCVHHGLALRPDRAHRPFANEVADYRRVLREDSHCGHRCGHVEKRGCCDHCGQDEKGP